MSYRCSIAHPPFDGRTPGARGKISRPSIDRGFIVPRCPEPGPPQDGSARCRGQPLWQSFLTRAAARFKIAVTTLEGGLPSFG